MWPRLGSSTFVKMWIFATLSASIVAAVDSGWLATHAALAPGRIFRGEVWRLVTWPLVEPGPLSLALTCIAIYRFGGELAVRWGDRRLRRFMLEIIIAAAVVTCAMAALTGHTYLFRLGGWAVADTLVIAWARQFPNATLVFYGILPLHGRELVNMTIGLNVLIAIFVGPTAYAPELAACVIAALYPVEWLRRS